MFSSKLFSLSIFFVFFFSTSVWASPLDGINEGFSGIFHSESDSSKEIPFEVYQYNGYYILKLNGLLYHLGFYDGQLIGDSYSFGLSNGLYQYYSAVDSPPKLKAVVVDVFLSGVREYMLLLKFTESQNLSFEKMILAVPLPGNAPEYTEVAAGYYRVGNKEEQFYPVYDSEGSITNLSERGEPIWKKVLVNQQNDCFTTWYPDFKRIGNCDYYSVAEFESVSTIPFDVIDYSRDSLLAGIKEVDDEQSMPADETIKSEPIKRTATNDVPEVEIVPQSNEDEKSTSTMLNESIKEQIVATVQYSNPSESVTSIKEQVNDEFPVYVVESSKIGKLFGLFNVSVPITREIASDGVAKKEEKPWWAIFVFG